MDGQSNESMVVEICCAWFLAGAMVLGLVAWSLVAGV